MFYCNIKFNEEGTLDFRYKKPYSKDTEEASGGGRTVGYDSSMDNWVLQHCTIFNRVAKSVGRLYVLWVHDDEVDAEGRVGL